MLPNSARIKSSSDFARVTKTGQRVATNSLIGYFLPVTESVSTPITNNNKLNLKLGLIVSRSVGNSVVRHRIARQIRHAVRDQQLPNPIETLLVIRVLKNSANVYHETLELLERYSTKSARVVITENRS